MEMEHTYSVDGILFSDVDTAEWYEGVCKQIGIRNFIKSWRVTSGGRVLGIVDIADWEQYVENRDWTWPVVPVTKAKVANDCWVTGTASTKISKVMVEQEGKPDVCRLAHRIVWAERRDGKLVSDPLRRRVFNRLTDIREFVREDPFLSEGAGF
jgi:hypothetical protein